MGPGSAPAATRTTSQGGIVRNITSFNLNASYRARCFKCKRSKLKAGPEIWVICAHFSSSFPHANSDSDIIVEEIKESKVFRFVELIITLNFC